MNVVRSGIKDRTERLPTPAAAPAGIDHYTLAPEHNTFRSLVVDLTHRCNMRCANCYIPNRDIPDMDVGRLYDLLDRLPKRTYIRLIGAEPTLRDDLPEIIRNVVRLGHKPSLNTNGLKLAHADYCRTLKEAGLTMVCISMNGADDDGVYRALDGGRYAGLKTRALRRCLELGFHINTGTIIARGVNESTIARRVATVERLAGEAGVDFATDAPWRRVPLVIRFKSLGAIGRHMDNGHAYDKAELAGLMAEQLGIDANDLLSRPIAGGLNTVTDVPADSNSAALPYETRRGAVLLRLVDWTVDGAGVVDPGSAYRGRITQDWRIAPFYEDIKINEFGY